LLETANASFGGIGPGGADQLVRFDQDLGVEGLLSGEKAEAHERRATQKAHQPDLPVGSPIRVVKRGGHCPSQAAADGARNRTPILTLLLKVTGSSNLNKPEST
jgi:hypothetical protein